ncbi:hypothetical protein [uncultured Limimaricola sp.]|uniref:hypothetical protein n=1 Tax=uncultured Limimaricola sp. TaxID=2211667 RepID=UPI0030FD0C80
MPQLSRILIGLAFFPQAPLCHAASFTPIGPMGPLDYDAVIEGTCSIEMSGTVAQGDAERLAALMKEMWLERDGFVPEAADWIDGSDEAMAICLKDSGGGDFAAGVELANEISDLGLTTFVPEGGRCESACAIALLGGVFPYFNEGLLPYRGMHSTSTVGFHAPSIELKGGTVTAAAINEAYAAAAESIYSLSELNRLTSNGLTMMGIQVSSDILNIILSTPADEMRYVETYSDAAVFDIAIFDRRHTMDESKVFRLCLNAMYWWRPSVFQKGNVSLLQETQMFSPKILREEGLTDADQMIEKRIENDLHGVETRRVQKPWGEESNTVVEFFGTWNDLQTCEVHHSGFDKNGWAGDVVYRGADGDIVDLGRFRAWHALPLGHPIASNWGRR